MLHTRTPTKESKQGSVPAMIRVQHDFSKATVPLVTVMASEMKPVKVRVHVATRTAYNAGTTNTLKIGTEADDDAFSGNLLATTKSSDGVLYEDTELIATYGHTGTAPDAGGSDIIIELTQLW